LGSQGGSLGIPGGFSPGDPRGVPRGVPRDPRGLSPGDPRGASRTPMGLRDPNGPQGPQWAPPGAQVYKFLLKKI